MMTGQPSTCKMDAVELVDVQLTDTCREFEEVRTGLVQQAASVFRRSLQKQHQLEGRVLCRLALAIEQV